METIDLQQKAEELVEQLHQLKGFSEKYAQNQEMAAHSLRQAADVIKSSQETLEKTNILIERASEFYKVQEEKLGYLQQSVSKIVHQHVNELSSGTKELLQGLQTSFLAQQEAHIQVLQDHSKAMITDIGTLQSTVKDELQALQTSLHNLAESKFTTVGNHLIEKSNHLENVVNMGFEGLSGNQHKDSEQTWKVIVSLKKSATKFFIFQITLILLLFAFVYWITRK